MKRQFVAFNGSKAAGPFMTEELAVEWAQKALRDNVNLGGVFICETIATVERVSPPITVKYIPSEADADKVAAKALAA